jgi:hypothetical protein
MIENCPICESSNKVFVKNNFLLSGAILEQAMGKPIPEKDKDDRTQEFLLLTLIGIHTDLKKSIQEMTRVTGRKNTMKDMIKKGRIQHLCVNDDDGNYWTVFGKLTPEELKRLRLQ